jgi:hypothetical protein
MAKTLITRDQLGRLVLETIRKESGCEGIKEVWISQAEVLGCGPSWRVSVLDEG